MISRGISRAALLDLTFTIGWLAMAVIAYRHHQRSLKVSLGYLYLYGILLLCVLALLLNISGVVWNGASLALGAFVEEEPESDGVQALLSTLPLIGHRASVHVDRAFYTYTRAELLERLVTGVAATVGVGGILLLHLWWKRRMAQRIGDSPIAWGYLYALVAVGFFLFLSYGQDLILAASSAIGGSVDWEDDLAVRHWARDLVAYGLNAGLALAVWLLSWRKAWRSTVTTSADAEEMPANTEEGNAE